MGGGSETPGTDGSNLRTECGRPVRHFQRLLLWCGECYETLLSGEVPRVCERWDKDPTPPGERYRALFRAAQTFRQAGITDENQIIPTLAFAARSFEMPNLKTLGDRLAGAEAGGEEWRTLKGTVRRAFDTFEVLRMRDGGRSFTQGPSS